LKMGFHGRIGISEAIMRFFDGDTSNILHPLHVKPFQSVQVAFNYYNFPKLL
jgi:hypothetical protein